MPAYTDEQHRRFYEKTGRWHYSAPEHLKKPPKERTLSDSERAAIRVDTQSYNVPGVAVKYPGSALARRDSLDLGIIREPEKLTDRGAALKRLSEGTATKADSIYLDLLPGAVQPSKPSYSLRDMIGPDGKPVLVRVNTDTGTMLPLSDTFRPKSAGSDAIRTRPINAASMSFSNKIEDDTDSANALAIAIGDKKATQEQDLLSRAAETRIAANSDSLSIAENARVMGYTDFNEAVADLKNLEDTMAEYEDMVKRYGPDKATSEFVRINRKSPAQVKNMIYNFRRPFNIPR